MPMSRHMQRNLMARNFGLTNHPNRGRAKSAASNPEPEDISRARASIGLTQSECALLVHAGLRSWQQWESGERRMHPAFWELFRIKSALFERERD